ADYGLRCARESERASCRLCVPSLLQAQVQVTAQTYGSRTPCRVNPLRQLGEGKNKQVSLPCRSSKCYSLDSSGRAPYASRILSLLIHERSTHERSPDPGAKRNAGSCAECDRTRGQSPATSCDVVHLHGAGRVAVIRP